MTQQNYDTTEQDVFVFPTSYAQQRLWFLDQLEPNSPYYNIPSAVRFQGKLNIAAFDQSVQEIIARHETLRTTFTMMDGEAVQVISPELKLEIPIFDLTDREPAVREKETQRLAREEARRPFNLTSGPLFRITLIKLADADFVVLLTMHHIISDGWSMGVFIREIAVHYDAFSQGKSAPLPELPIQYADFAQWQQEWLTGDVLEEQIDYWRNQLQDVPPVLELPLDQPRPAIQSARGATETVSFPAELLDSLKQLSRQQDVTLFMTLLAAFQTLLYRYSGQTQISVGSPIANRTRAEIEGLIGFFVNTLVLNANLEADPTFTALLKQVKEVTLGAYAHQDVPFEKIVEALQPERNMSHTPLFQVMFVLQNTPMQVDMELPDVRLSSLDVDAGTSTFDLTLLMVEDGAGLEATIEYNTDIFNAATIRRMLSHFQTLLKNLVANPSLRVSRFALANPAEIQKMLEEWNQTADDSLRDRCVHQLFEVQAAQTPEAVAVVSGDRKLSYAELNQRANQLAHFLVQMGVTTETGIGISLERSPEMIIGLLAILKAGAAYVPLDPKYPAERLNLMIEDSGIEFVLTHSRLQEIFQGEIRKICIDTEWEAIRAGDSDNPEIEIDRENLAYVIYTSGSTGTPKGVQVTHRSVVNHNLSVIQKFELTDSDRVLQFATINFDTAVEEIFPTLAVGATLVLRNNEILLTAQELMGLIERERLTVVNLSTPYWHEWVAEMTRAQINVPASIRLVILGGDKASVARVRDWLAHGGKNIRLLNTYGPTETTIISSFYELTENEKQGNLSELPVGRPLPNTQLFVLDQNFQPTPVGVPGELFIGGTGLARGYLNRPDLTAERFVPNPFGAKEGERLYRTGDRVRYREDGQIEFFGRVDFQIKIRGFRVELGEIEAMLRKHSALSEVAVIARQPEGVATEKQIVAYFVTKHENPPDISDLRNFVKLQLPEYMTPAHFIPVEKIPLTPSGKVDARKLPAPDFTETEHIYVAPSSETEITLTELWQDILNLEKIGIHDNFFEVGGHSLLATQVVSRVREKLEIEIPLRNVFEFPTIAELALAIDSQKGTAGIQLPPIEPVSRDRDLPLSFAQQRLWFLDQLEPESTAYNIPTAVRVRGELALDILQQSIDEIIRRHESLRTCFRLKAGRPVQIILPEMALKIREVDLQNQKEDLRETEILRLARQDAETSFNLSTGPLLRITVLQLAEADFVILFTVHHIIADDWSTNILIGELAALYDAFAKKQPSPLRTLPLQYADYAAWQQQWLTGEPLEAQLAYWKAQLDGIPSQLELPTDRPRPKVQTFNGSFVEFEFPTELSRKILEFGNQAGATLFMTLLAGFQTLLQRYSGQNDICVGSPIANRTRSEVENIIGCFINTLVFRSQFSEGMTFRELLHNVKQTALGAYAHQDIPFERLVDALNPERDLSHSPLFQVMLVLQNTPKRRQELSTGLTLEPIEAEGGTAKFDLTLFVVEENEKLSGALEYNTDLFDAATIQRMLHHFEQLFEAVVEQPDQLVTALPLMSAVERAQLIKEFNDTATEYPLDQAFHYLFEEQVARTPDAIAVTFNDTHLTYAELNARANQFAHFLRQKNVGPESLIAICFERSPEMMVGLLGILKAGGAYVPIDPTSPKERIHYILSDSDAALLVTQQKLGDILPELSQTIIFLDSGWKTIASGSPENPVHQTEPENLAYMIYTSGSTGKPKGTLIHHRGLANYLHWCINNYPLKQRNGALVHSSLAFDATVTGLYAPLLVGNRVTLSPETKDLEVLTNLIRSHQDFGLIKITPAHLELLGKQLEPTEAAGKTRAFIIGGENLTTEHIAFWQENAPDTRLINEYGPTETVVGCMNYQAPVGQSSPSSIAIGYPIANTQIYLLDSRLEPVPIGVIGELFIGGTGVARGYLNLPALTAEKFIPDPFSDRPGSRLYRSGDLARFLPDGNIEFLGRIDDQVKIRGFRVELGEIEVQLQQIKGIQEAAVISLPDNSGNLRLVAYYTAIEDFDLSTSALRQKLGEKLPEYMLPAAFVRLEEIPLTTNGKVDRKALPEPGEERQDLESHYVAPQTPQQKAIAGIWQEVLGVEKVGILDNFFEIGGHSLMATQVISRLREVFQAEVPLRILFEAPTIAGLSRFLKQNVGLAEMPELVPVSRELPLKLSFAQQRLWFLDQLEPDSPFYNIPSAFRLQGKLDLGAFEKTLEYLIVRHESLRTVFRTEGGEPFQVILENPDFELNQIDLGEIDAAYREQQAMKLIEQDARQPFNLSDGPLFRVSLLQMAADDFIVVFTMHHIISDGWSIGVLVREVAEVYDAFSQNQAPQLPALPIQYADFAAWQRNWLQGAVLEAQLNYWKNQLADAPPLLEMPTDFPRPAVQSFNGATESRQISPEIVLALDRIGQENGATQFMTLLAAFQTLLYRYSGQADICVGTPIANRNRAETEGLIGFFVNTLVMRTHLVGDATFAELLASVRETALGAYAHQDVPFEMLVESLKPERNLSHTPLFQVMLVLQNLPMQGMELNQVRLSTLEAKNNTANFDLTLGLVSGTDGMDATLEYNTDLFRAETIRGMLERFSTLLTEIAQSPEKKISEYSLLSSEEVEKVTRTWNQTTIDYPDDKLASELFEAQVAATPRSIALVFESQKLTYSELNARANQLAHFLQKQGVGSESIVGVCVEKSIEMVVGLLGVLKAGGAYLPMDPNYPKERLDYMIQDSGTRVILTQDHLLGVLPKNDAKTICLDSQWDLIRNESGENLEIHMDPMNLAYVIYTSGSTGRPKGVMLRHQGLCNLTQAQIKDFRVTPESRVLQFASFSFDASVSEVFMALHCGATLYLARPESMLPGPDLLRLLEDEEITTVTLPPSVLAVLPDHKLSGVRTIVSAGERCSWEIAKRWSRGRRFLNAYGPTENTVCASSYHVEVEEKGATAPIGIPMENVRLYILDEFMNLVPPGVPGELHIGGVGLARGYLNRPDLTATKFIPNPFNDQPGERLYRTGDLVRHLPDGNIEFLGRIDHQIKIRGFRIELEEIEKVLEQHPKIQDVLVLVREHAAGDARLLAYLIPKADENPEVPEIQEHLREKLPEYMIPSALILLESFPLTPNGKIDRNALPAPDYGGSSSRAAYVAPRDSVELKLTQLWEQILGVGKIGVKDNFFELGGHSLLAVRLMAKIEQEFDKSIQLVTLFQEPTIEHLARNLRDEKSRSSWSPLVELHKSESTKPAFYVVHPSGGSVHWYADLSKLLIDEFPLYGFQARGLIGKQKLQTEITEMASLYVDALLEKQPQGPYFLGSWSLGVIIVYEMAQQLQAMGHEIGLLAMLDQGPVIPKEAPVDDVGMLIEMFSRYFPLSENELRQMDAEERLKFVLKKARKARVVPLFIRFKDFRHYVEVIDVQTQAWRRYSPKPYSGLITVFRTEESRKKYAHEPDLGWQANTNAKVELVDIPGDHITMLDEPHVANLAREIKERMRKKI